MSYAIRDLGPQLAVYEVGAGSAVAGGTGDNTKVTGESMDLSSAQGSGKLIICYKTTLTADKTLSFTVASEDSDDNSSWDAEAEVYAKTAVETGAATGELDCLEIDVDLSGASRYRRYNITPDLSHTSSDEAVWSAVFVANKQRVS